jgi:hypothetical protein
LVFLEYWYVVCMRHGLFFTRLDCQYNVKTSEKDHDLPRIRTRDLWSSSQHTQPLHHLDRQLSYLVFFNSCFLLCLVHKNYVWNDKGSLIDLEKLLSHSQYNLSIGPRKLAKTVWHLRPIFKSLGGKTVCTAINFINLFTENQLCF